MKSKQNRAKKKKKLSAVEIRKLDEDADSEQNPRHRAQARDPRGQGQSQGLESTLQPSPGLEMALPTAGTEQSPRVSSPKAPPKEELLLCIQVECSESEISVQV